MRLELERAAARGGESDIDYSSLSESTLGISYPDDFLSSITEYRPLLKKF